MWQMICRHLCMESRGVQQKGMITRTSRMTGSLRESAVLRSEFLSMISLRGEDV
ncbi:MAG: hypothetical protein E4H07_09295 [Nitrosomonadales bacterium]|nr:MAG: hypothetical protein E4H07_09295 [Nitrosomonadales bacterium]